MITIELERDGPRVQWGCLHESDELRILDWLDSRPELLELVVAALELEQRR